MKRLLSFFILSALLISLVGCGKPDVELVPHSDEIKFGMTKEQVEDIAGELSDDQDFWVQSNKISLGVDGVTVSYNFVNDSLCKVRYNISYTEDAQAGIIESLKKKYGDPISENLSGGKNDGPYWGFIDGNDDYSTSCYISTMGLTGDEEQVIVMSGKYEAMPESPLYKLKKKL
nr:MAG TPA: outer membrane protein assembly factor [Caudoviricetes sp.]